jgi:N4-gp56 family major capsid protein
VAVENATTTAGLSEELRTYYSMRLIQRLLARLPLFQDAQKTTIPKGSGKVVSFRKWASLALATSALTEGDPPSAQTLDTSEVTATLAEYGGYVKISRLAIDIFIDRIADQAEQILAEQGGRSLHSLLATVVTGGSVVQYVNNAANRAALAATDTVNVAEIEEAVRTLELANVPRFSDGYYHGFTSPNVAYDIKRDPEYRELFLGGGESGSNALRQNTLTPVGGVKIMTSTDASTFTGTATATVHALTIYGPDAFGVVDLAGRDGLGRIDPDSQLGLALHVIPAESDSKSDPLHQFGTVGWLSRFVAKRIDESRMVRIEAGVTA